MSHKESNSSKIINGCGSKFLVRISIGSLCASNKNEEIIEKRLARFYEDRVFKALTERVFKGEDVQV